MYKIRSKKLTILLTLIFVLSIMLPLAGPASAASDNAVSRVVSVADNFSGVAATLTIQEKADFLNQFTAGQVFKLVLPAGVKWNTPPAVRFNGAAVPAANVAVRTDQVLEITMVAGTAARDNYEVDLDIAVDGATGDIAVTIDPMDSTVTGQTLVFARVGVGKTLAVAESKPSIGQVGTGGIIRIEERYVNSMTNAAQDIVLRLPSNFVWDPAMAAANVVAAGDFAPWAAAVVLAGTNTSTLTVTITPAANNAQRGTIYITPRIMAKSGAKHGEVTVTVSGTNVDTADLVVAEYVDWGATVKVKEVKELLAGKFDDVTTETITIEEKVLGSLIGGRDLTIELPSWVKITNIRNWAVSGGGPGFNGTLQPTVGAAGPIDGTTSDMNIRIAANSTGKGKIEFRLDLSIEGNKSGDITAKFSGAGIAPQELVIAKAVPPVALAGTPAEIRIGVQEQAVSDVLITELKKGALERTAEMAALGVSGFVTLTTSQGVKFSAKPTVAVVEGDLEIDSALVTLDTNDTVLRIPIKNESIRPGKIKVSNIKLTVDRSVPEGDITLGIGGSAVIENSMGAFGWRGGVIPGGGAANTLDAGEFNTGTAAKIVVARVVTPAPGDTKQSAAFVIGATTYTVGGVEAKMDVAPYVKEGRTYLPVRYAGYALGVAEENIFWDNTTGTATLIKGDRVVQFTVGKKAMLINGSAIALDVAPEVTNGRVMLPFRWIATAFGASVLWDGTTQTVTMEL